MSEQDLSQLFQLHGQVAVITGAAGVLCSTMSSALAAQGVKVALLDFDAQRAETLARQIQAAGGEALAVPCSVLDKAGLQAACQTVLDTFGRVDILINGAGGNRPQATTRPDLAFFDLPLEAVEQVFDLNFMGTFLACQVFGAQMARQGSGVILNIASMNAYRPLTRIPAYSAAKAAVLNLTQWLAVHLAQNYSPTIRVNAIAPGFFLTQQNRFLLTDETTGQLTPRGQTILAHTPMNRFGTPDDLTGTVLWLLSPASAFVTGAVIPIDGGFNAFSGV